MPNKVIDLRSDAVTLPVKEMYSAIQNAPLGTDRFCEDPTVRKLEEKVASELGKEASILMPSGTMCNLTALMIHGQGGDAVVVESRSHIFRHESGGVSKVAGLIPIPIKGENGIFPADKLTDILTLKGLGVPAPAVLCLENTHNLAGGVPLQPNQSKLICELAKEHGLTVHLDGARLHNAAVALDVSLDELTSGCDSVMISLSKGLSAPIGSLLAGSEEFITEARRIRRMLGGEMYQAGIVAAAGIVAIEQMVDQLIEDHRIARLLAEGLANIQGIHIDLGNVHTNIVVFDISGLGLRAQEFVQRLRSRGVLTSFVTNNHVRMVTHRHITQEDVPITLDAVGELIATAEETYA